MNSNGMVSKEQIREAFTLLTSSFHNDEIQMKTGVSSGPLSTIRAVNRALSKEDYKQIRELGSTPYKQMIVETVAECRGKKLPEDIFKPKAVKIAPPEVFLVYDKFIEYLRCPCCGGRYVYIQTKDGREFYGCEDYYKDVGIHTYDRYRAFTLGQIKTMQDAYKDALEFQEKYANQLLKGDKHE